MDSDQLKKSAADESKDIKGLMRKGRGQASADRRAQLQPLKKTIRDLEARLEKGQQALDALQNQLADGDLYTQSAGDELAELVKQEGQLKRELAEIEGEWLEQQALCWH